jgi:cupin fold WbuC family metalloprotein
MTTKADNRSLIADPENGLFREDPLARSLSYFSKQLPVKVDADLIAELDQISTSRGNVNVRLSLHLGPDAAHHDMIVLQRRGTYVRPHHHEGKGEAFHMMTGRLGIACFNEAGDVLSLCVLNPGEIFRVAEGGIHALLPLTDPVIYHENKQGPFRRGTDSIYPKWAPPDSDSAGIAEFLGKLASLFEDQPK